jgi:hypothetical protein
MDLSASPSKPVESEVSHPKAADPQPETAQQIEAGQPPSGSPPQSRKGLLSGLMGSLRGRLVSSPPPAAGASSPLARLPKTDAQPSAEPRISASGASPSVAVSAPYRALFKAIAGDIFWWRAWPAKSRDAAKITGAKRKPTHWLIRAILVTPWWLISVGLHVLLLLIMSFIYMERLLAVYEGEVTLTIHRAEQPVLNDFERPRDVFERKGIPKDEAGPPTEEPAIFFPEAKESDHNESADNEDYHQMKGDSKEFLSYIKGDAGGFRGRQDSKTPGVYDTMGVGPGGGGGGRYGGRFGGRENLVARGGGTYATEGAVLAGLRWLARHQAEDGHWGARSFQEQCGKIIEGKCAGNGHEDNDVGVTGLALLAFLGAGYTHLSRDVYDGICFGTVVKKGNQWLIQNQDAEGCVGPRQGHYMYCHAIAALALSEAFGLTGTELLRDNAQRSINFVVSAQNPYKAWRYSHRCRDNDTSVTGWCVMALKSAEISGLQTSGSAFQWAKTWIDSVTTSDGQTGYTNKPGKENRQNDAMTAVGMMCRIFIDKKKEDPRLKGGAEHVTKSLPDWKHSNFYAWYYISLALFQYDGPDGPYWKKWNERMKETLVTHQRKKSDGCMNGSWDAIGPWGGHGGRVYSTAINTLTLEVYYRYDNVFGSGRK